MVAFSGLCRSLSRLAKGTTQYKFWKPSTNYTGLPIQRKSQAVSDGELNMSSRGSGGSCTSLPGTQRVDAQASSVVSWAVCFEKLLEDPVGLRYFTAFLRSEVSAENILFYKACENFRKIPPNRTKELSEEACSIFQTYLSDHAPYPVNIDDTARVEEKDLHKPTADMFDKAQTQIFKLMKMDSYRRFVRSPLYQKCTLASVEGKPLPSIPSEPTCTRSWENMATASPSLNDIKKKEKHWENRGSWGVEVSYPKNGHSGPRPSDQGQGDGGGAEGGYCCVYLPDGSASLAPTRPGLPLREMLSALCEKRCFPLKDVVIYLQGKEKPLTMDQDSSVLRDQQVYLELRVTFTLEVVFTGKTVGIMVKSSKTLQEALSTVLQKHQLGLHQALVTMSGSDVPLNMTTNVLSLANKKLQLDKVKVTSPRSGGQSPSAQEQATCPVRPEVSVSPPTDRPKPRVRKNPEMEEMIELLSRAQACRVDDQRGPLTKEHLELPQFLLKPPVQDQQTPQGEDGKATGCPGKVAPTDTKNTAVKSISTSTPVGGANTDSSGSKHKNPHETFV
ncbi:regulator of G-protein signaling 14 isoform X2 [Esox lucius]|uniref:regulator of G-protein signaling 14 isoform X2 n=1 Tax=Esox lucius TaxID=8010 RepID=UPI000577DC85|nr:regulator of G-protein signaling 14 isoform X2 [Esox lucius]